MKAPGPEAARRASQTGPRIPGAQDSLRYRLMRIVDRLLVRALFRLGVEGLERWPEAPFCLVVNHHNGWDPLIVMAATPATPRITWFGPREADFSRGFKNRVMGSFGGVIPFDPAKTKLTSAAHAVRHVFAVKGVLGIFAEGHNGFREAELQPFEDGAVAFASMAGVPIVPCAISGTTHLWLGKRVSVRFGAPIATAGIRGASARAELGEEVRRAIVTMLPRHEPRLPRRRPFGGLLTDLFHAPGEAERREADRNELGE
jgi:1-acyl-sn-glycerol-3-phosphate acyltransferase